MGDCVGCGRTVEVDGVVYGEHMVRDLLDQLTAATQRAEAAEKRAEALADEVTATKALVTTVRRDREKAADMLAAAADRIVVAEREAAAMRAVVDFARDLAGCSVGLFEGPAVDKLGDLRGAIAALSATAKRQEDTK